MSTPMSTPAGVPDEPMLRRAFDTQAEFGAQLQTALLRAQSEVWMADADFAQWPIGHPEFASALQGFLRQSAANHLRMLTLDAAHIARSAPRLMTVLRTHAHNAECRIVPSHAAPRFGEACAMLIVDRSFLVRRFHHDHPRGATELDPAAALPWLDQFEMLWEESSPALSSTTLGLG
ncbi:MAG: hypothetical protein ACR2GP_15465 [Burkholderiaceae bacterium]